MLVGVKRVGRRKDEVVVLSLHVVSAAVRIVDESRTLVDEALVVFTECLVVDGDREHVDQQLT